MDFKSLWFSSFYSIKTSQMLESDEAPSMQSPFKYRFLVESREVGKAATW